MSFSAQEVSDRAVPSHSAMVQLQTQSSWVWAEMTPVQFKAQMDALNAQRELEARLNAAQEDARGLVDRRLKLLETLTVNGKAAGQFHFREASEKLAVLNALVDYGAGRSDTLDEARDFEAAWDEIESGWIFASGYNLAAYKALRPEIEQLRKDYSDAKTAWRSDASKLTTLTAQLSDVLVAWYDAATRNFPENTPEGVMLRGTIPTYYSPSAGGQQPAVTPPAG